MAAVDVRVLPGQGGKEVYMPIVRSTGRLAMTGIHIYLASRTRAESRAKLISKMAGLGHTPTFTARPR